MLKMVKFLSGYLKKVEKIILINIRAIREIILIKRKMRKNKLKK